MLKIAAFSAKQDILYLVLLSELQPLKEQVKNSFVAFGTPSRGFESGCV
jgi:hypothetical protein